jgi:hypothetical protein
MNLPTGTRPFFANRILFLVAVACVFALGLGVRLYDLQDAPLDFHPTRQLHSAVMARGMYLQEQADAPDWQREIAVRQWQAEGVIEPPLLEWLSSQVYQLAGNELLWFPRLFSILAWVLGGIAILLAARDLSGPDGALIALAFYLLLPYGMIASRSFQPDPLMTALIAFFVWSVLRWNQRQTLGWAVAAGLLGGLAVLVKAVAVFFVGAAWVGLIFGAIGLRKAVRNRQLWLAAALTLIPYLLYMAYGLWISGDLTSQFGGRFFPGLWVDPAFYLRWAGMIARVTGTGWLLAGLLGTLLLKSPQRRGLLLGLWAGYFVYGLTLPHHIGTHDYYSLPLIVPVALGLASVASLVLGQLAGRRWPMTALTVAVLLYGSLYPAYQARTTLKRTDYTQEVAMWQHIGEVIGPGASVTALAPDYAYGLAYWGWVTPDLWYTLAELDYRAGLGEEQDFETWFEQKAAGKDFFVVTLFDELERQPELRDLLEQNYPVLDEGPGYRVYDLRD